MSDGGVDAVQQPSDTEPAESAVAQDDATQGSLFDAGVETPTAEPESTPHPLEPDGARFKQVYARAKDAEYKYQAEREARARAEGELEALRTMREAKPEPAATPELSWSQLQAYVDEGKLTMPQAMEYREQLVRKAAEKVSEEKVRTYLDTTQRQQVVQSELAKYTQAVPEVAQPGTPERLRVEQEFRYLVTMGYDAKDTRTEILALRAALGDPETAAKRRAAKAIPMERDTMQDTAAPGKPKPSAKDPLTTLTPAQKDHYTRMISRGMYPKGWEDVREELNFQPTL